MVVFDKTGTLTQGVFEVNGIHHNEMENEKLLEYAAHAECASSHPISRSLQRAYGKEVDRSRVENIREISGNGVLATVDGERGCRRQRQADGASGDPLRQLSQCGNDHPHRHRRQIRPGIS